MSVNKVLITLHADARRVGKESMSVKELGKILTIPMGRRKSPRKMEQKEEEQPKVFFVTK